MAARTAEATTASPREARPDGSIFIAGRNVCFLVILLKPGFVLTICKGGSKDASDFAAEDALFKEYDLALERSETLTMFADARESTRIGAETRERSAAWARKHHGRLTSHVLMRSKLIEMALSIVSMLAGGGGISKVYSRPEAFLDAIREVTTTITKLPVI